MLEIDDNMMELDTVIIGIGLHLIVFGAGCWRVAII